MKFVFAVYTVVNAMVLNYFWHENMQWEIVVPFLSILSTGYGIFFYIEGVSENICVLGQYTGDL